MKQEDRDIALIEKYMENKLSNSETVEFDNRRQQDKSFQKLLEDMSVLITGIKNSARYDLLFKLKETENSLSAVKIEKETKLFYLKKYRAQIAVAASVIVIIASTLLITISKRQTDVNEYLNKFFVPYPNLIHPTQRANDDQLSNDELAYYYYDNKQYELAIKSFEEQLKKQENIANLIFYLGNSYLFAGETDKAIKNFTILLDKYEVYQNQARWFLSLCYLKENKVKEAKEHLLILKNSKNAYSEKAGLILKKIE